MDHLAIHTVKTIRFHGDFVFYLHTEYEQTDIHASDGIRTHNPIKRATADPLLRPRSHQDWLADI
jgi:hypothetical protein